MTIAHYSPKTTGDGASRGPARFPTQDHPLHLVSKVRRRERVALRTVARQMDESVEELKHQEQETTDISLSVLHRWAEALGVPARELLTEPDEGLSAPLMQRAQMIRLMKTVVTILERSSEESVKRLARMMSNQLVEIMPELGNVGSWPVVGKRRRREELGRTAETSLSDDWFLERND